jgi:hypothetical protein
MYVCGGGTGVELEYCKQAYGLLEYFKFLLRILVTVLTTVTSIQRFSLPMYREALNTLCRGIQITALITNRRTQEIIQT